MYHVSYKFRNAGKDRSKKWTESFYIDLVDLDTAQARADSLAAVLTPLHGKQSILTGYRLSDPMKTRAGTLRIPGKNAPPITPATFDADYPSTGLQLQVVATDGTVVNQSIRGLMDDLIIGGDKVPSAVWDPLFDNLKSYIETPANLIKLWVLDPEAFTWPIDSISSTGVVSLPPFLIPDNTQVIITGRGIPKYFRKVWRILNIDAASVQLRGFREQIGFEWRDMVGDLTVRTMKKLTIKSFDFMRSTSHKVTKEKN